MKREAFKMYLKPGCEAEYEKRHAAIWPELKALLSQNGVSDYSIYWDKLLLNASQVTNPSIDPLREPMETQTFLGAKPRTVVRDEEGRLINNLKPQLELAVPIMFSAMSYGSISYNAHASLARAAQELGIFYYP